MIHERIPTELAAPEQGRRVADRPSVSLTCHVRSGSEPWRICRAYDLSADGVRLNWAPQLSAGRKIWLRIGELAPIPATICWSSANGTGCQFDQPISGYVLDHLVRSSGV